MSAIRNYDTMDEGKNSGDPTFSVKGVVYSIGVTGIHGRVRDSSYIMVDDTGLLRTTVSETRIEDIKEISLENPTNAEVLTFEDGKWVNKVVDTTLLLDELLDVALTSPENDEVLVFENGEWVNKKIELNGIDDVVIGTLSTNQILLYDGSNWVNGTLTIPQNLQDFDNVEITSPQNNQLLTYVSGEWINQSLPLDPVNVSGYRGFSTTGNSIILDATNATSFTLRQSTFTPGQFSLDLQPSLAPGFDHAIGAYSTALGGENNIIPAPHSIVSGEFNAITGSGYSVIMSGSNNEIEDRDCFIATGTNNRCSSIYSSVITGEFNVITSNNSIVLNGEYNVIASPYSTVLNGIYNRCDSSACAILGDYGQGRITNSLTISSGSFSGSALPETLRNSNHQSTIYNGRCRITDTSWTPVYSGDFSSQFIGEEGLFRLDFVYVGGLENVFADRHTNLDYVFSGSGYCIFGNNFTIGVVVLKFENNLDLDDGDNFGDIDMRIVEDFNLLFQVNDDQGRDMRLSFTFTLTRLGDLAIT